jgi:hypothetical protein
MDGLILRKEIKVKDRILQVELPEEFEGKTVETTIRLKRKGVEEGIMADKIRIDTRKWKFNREEAHGR